MNRNKIVRFKEPLADSESEIEQEEFQKEIYPKNCNIRIGNKGYYVEDKTNAILNRVELTRLETSTYFYTFGIIFIVTLMNIREKICDNPIFNLCDDDTRVFNRFLIGIIVVLVLLIINNCVNMYRINSKFCSECNQ